jgi:hypothetical protein
MSRRSPTDPGADDQDIGVETEPITPQLDAPRPKDLLDVVSIDYAPEP